MDPFSVIADAVGIAAAAVYKSISISSYRQMEQMQKALNPALKERKRQIKLEEEVTQNQIAVVDHELNQISIVGHVEEPADLYDEESKAELIDEVKKYRDLLNDLKEASAAAADTTQKEGVRQKFQDVEVKNAQMLMGLVNIDTKGRFIDQDFNKVKVEGSKGAMGIVDLKDPATFQALWTTPSTGTG